MTQQTYIHQLVDEVAQLRKALRRSEDQWRTTFEQAVVGMAHVSLTGHWLGVNARMCKILGYSADELLAKTVQSLTHPEDWARELAASEQLLTGALPSYVTNKRYCHKDGHFVWGRLTLSLAYTAEGRPDYFVGMVEDLSALRQAEAALHASEERYQQIVEAQADLICRFDPDLRLTFVNPAYAAITGKTPAALMGVRITDLIPPEYREQVIQQVKSQNRTGSPANSENPIILPDGSLRWFEWTDRAIFDEQGTVLEYQAVGRDITARRQAEAAERSQRQLAEGLLASLAALTTSLDVDQVMNQILASAATVVPSEAGSILLFEQQYGRVAYCRGFTPAVTAGLLQYRFALESWPNIYHIFTQRVPYVVSDTQTAANWIVCPPTAWIRSSIGVPIERDGQVIGVLIADSTSPHYFTATDVEKLQAFARYASLALTNAYHATLLEEQVKSRTVELQTAKEQVEAILNHSRDGIVLVQPDLSIVKSNPAFCTLFRCCQHDCQGCSLLMLIHPDDVIQVEAAFRHVWQQGEDMALEARVCPSDGTTVDVALSISVIQEVGLVCTLRNISEWKARERQLRYYASLQENVGEAVLTTDLHGVIQSWNKAAELIYGWRTDEVIGKQHKEILQTHFPSAIDDEQIWQTLRTVGRWQEEVIQQHRDGRPRHILATLTLLRDAQGDALGLVAINRDITEHKATAIALEESRHFAERVANMAPNIIYVYDFPTQRNVYANHNLVTLLGYTVDDFAAAEGCFVQQLLHPADTELFSRHLMQILAGADGQIFPFEHRIRHKDGQWHWFLSHSTIFQRGADGTVLQFLGVATDITDRKVAVERLQEQRDFLQLIIDQVPALISVKDQSGRYQLVNQHSAELFGITAAAMVGKTDADLNPNPAELAFIRQKDEEVLTTGRVVFIPEQTIMGNYYQTSKIPLRNQDGVAERLLIVSVDIHERKRTEAALQHALQTEKELSALKSGFITTTSHEFRTPLAAILALTETLSAYRHRLSEAQIEERLTKIRQQVDHLKGLMVDVLELARIQARRVSFAPVALDPALFCRNLLAEFPHLFGVHHQLIYQGADHLPHMALDQRLLHQILTNLLSNAVKYSPVTQPVVVALTYAGNQLTLQVRDEGIGIPAADLPHLFQPFQRAGNVGAIPGTGLGLAITKEAVELHGGTITATSIVDVGTTMTVCLPVPHTAALLAA